MKRTVKAFVCLILAVFTVVSAVCFAPTAPALAATETLVVYNCADYLDLTLIEEFENYYKEVTGNNLKLVYSTYDTNETMYTEVSKGDSSIDIIVPSEYAIQKLRDNNLIYKVSELWETYGTPLGLENPNRNGLVNSEIIDKIDGIFGDMSDYTVPYMWGTLGIMYNAEYVTEEDLSAGWGIFWNVKDNPKLHHKILVKDSIRDTYAMAVLYLKEYDLLPDEYKGYTNQELINCTDESFRKIVEQALKDQRDVIKGYEVDFGKDDLINGIAYVDLAWSGDAMYAIEEAAVDGVELGYYVPEIGSNIWFDGMCIPKTSKNPRAAVMFIEYMCRPISAVRNMYEIGYTSAVEVDKILADEEAMAFMAECYDEFSDEDKAYYGGVEAYIEEYFSDETRYPDATDPNLGVMQTFKDNDAMISMWERVKAHGIFSWKLVVFFAAMVAAVAAAWGIGVLVRELRGRKRLLVKR